MKTPRLLRAASVAGLMVLPFLAAAGCGDDEDAFSDRSKAFGTAPGATSASSIGPSSETKAGKAAAAELAKAAAVPKGGAGGKKGPKVAVKVYSDKELEAIAAYVVAPDPPMDETFFAEAIDNRDPFRPFTPEVPITTDDASSKSRTVDCKLAAYSVDELKLAGIISGIAVPRATFIDPGGTGWTVLKGDCLGRTGGKVTRMKGDEVTLIEVSPASGVEVERTLKLHPGAIDLRKAMKSGDPTLFRPPPLPEVVDGLGVVPGAVGGPVAPKPKLAVGMSKANFVKHYGMCFVKRPSIAGFGTEIWTKNSTAGECADIVGGLVQLEGGRVSAVSAGLF